MRGSIRKSTRRSASCAGGIKALAEVISIIGSATLAVQTVVLGASLFQKGSLAAAGRGSTPEAASQPAEPSFRQANVRVLAPSSSGAFHCILAMERAMLSCS